MVTRHFPPACLHFLVEQFWPHIISDIIYYGDQDKSPSHLPASPHCKQRRKIVWRIVTSDSPLLLFVGPQDWLYSKLADINIFLIQNRPGRPDVKYIQ